MDRRSRYARTKSAATNGKRLFTRIQEWLQPFSLRPLKPRRFCLRTCPSKPGTEEVAARLLTLPLYGGLEEDKIEAVIEGVLAAVDRA